MPQPTQHTPGVDKVLELFPSLEREPDGRDMLLEADADSPNAPTAREHLVSRVAHDPDIPYEDAHVFAWPYTTGEHVINRAGLAARAVGDMRRFREHLLASGHDTRCMHLATREGEVALSLGRLGFKVLGQPSVPSDHPDQMMLRGATFTFAEQGHPLTDFGYNTDPLPMLADDGSLADRLDSLRQLAEGGGPFVVGSKIPGRLSTIRPALGFFVHLAGRLHGIDFQPPGLPTLTMETAKRTILSGIAFDLAVSGGRRGAPGSTRLFRRFRSVPEEVRYAALELAIPDIPIPIPGEVFRSALFERMKRLHKLGSISEPERETGLRKITDYVRQYLTHTDDRQQTRA